MVFRSFDILWPHYVVLALMFCSLSLTKPSFSSCLLFSNTERNIPSFYSASSVHNASMYSWFPTNVFKYLCFQWVFQIQPAKAFLCTGVSLVTNSVMFVKFTEISVLWYFNFLPIIVILFKCQHLTFVRWVNVVLTLFLLSHKSCHHKVYGFYSWHLIYSAFVSS